MNLGKEAFSLEDEMVVVCIPFNFTARHIDDPRNALISDRREEAPAEGRLSFTAGQQKVLDYFANHPNASLAEVSKECGLSIGGAKKITVQLQTMNALERRGAKNNSIWIVKSEQ